MRRAILLSFILLSGAALRGEDCNRNGVEDAVEIADGAAADCDGNGVPDGCDVRLRPVGFRLAGRLATSGGWRLRAVDLDRDGDADMIVPPAGFGGSLDVYRNRGNGTFEHQEVDPRGGIRAPAAADLDGDGFTDMAIAGRSYRAVVILWGNGEGTFEDVTTVSQTAVSLAVADVDLDGNLDLVVGNARHISVLGNTGRRRFEEDHELAVPAEELLAADLDADGDVDLVAGGSSVTILLSNGRGTFSEGPSYAPGEWSSLGMGDLDGDGDLDVSGLSEVGPENAVLRIVWNDGTGAFLEETVVAARIVVQKSGDLDGDGDPDFALVEGGTTPRLRIALNDGKGAFLLLPGYARIPPRPRAMEIADFDGDGWPDIALSDRDTEEVLLLTQDPLSPDDCDGDGVPDTCTGRAADCDGDGLGDFCDLRLGFGVDCNGNDTPDRCDLDSGASADCNENTIPDECDIASGTSLDLIKNGVPDECDRDCNRNGLRDLEEVDAGLAPDCNRNGSPDDCDIFSNLGFSEPVEVPGLTYRALDPIGPPVHADLDGDGDRDIVLPLPFALGISRRLGGGRFVDERLPLGFDPRFVAAADFDRDGDVDLVTANESSDRARGLPANASFLSNDGSGGFVVSRNIALGTHPGPLVAGDFAGDGYPDVAIVDGSYPSSITILVNDSGDSFLPSHVLSAQRSLRSLTAADLDGDGDDELMALAGRELLIWRRAANGFEEWRQQLPEEAHSSVAADLDADGDPDVAIRTTKGVFILRNNGGVLELSGSYTMVEKWLPGSSTLVSGDPDGDSDLDLLIPIKPVRGDESFFLENLGPASFVPRRISPLPADFGSLADIDEDGRDDFLFPSNIGRRIVRVSFSFPGASSDCDRNLIPDDCQPDCDKNGIADTCDIATSGDCNRNGLPDACDVDPQLLLQPVRELQLSAALRQLAVVDLDRDGMNDLLAATKRSHVTLFRNLGGFDFEPTELVPLVGLISSHALADLDLDGDDDLAMGSGRWVIIFRNETFGFKGMYSVEVEQGPALSLANGDLDGDLDADLSALIDGAILVLRNRGNGTFEVTDEPVPVGCCSSAQAALDIDSDGDLDLLTERRKDCGSSCSDRWILLRNRGDASFEVVAVEGTLGDLLLVTGATVDPAAVSAALVSGIPDQTETEADIDGDGIVDRVDPRRAEVLFARGDRTDVRRTIPLLDPNPALRLGLGDLDGDGDPDLVAGSADSSLRYTLRLFRNDTFPALSQDRNLDGLPDECDPRIPFHRGDPDGDGRATLADGVSTLRSLFLGGAPSRCRESADFGNDGRVDLTDPVALFRFLFLGGPPPELPGPPGAPCGRDADPPGSARDLGCEVYEGC